MTLWMREHLYSLQFRGQSTIWPISNNWCEIQKMVSIDALVMHCWHIWHGLKVPRLENLRLSGSQGLKGTRCEGLEAKDSMLSVLFVSVCIDTSWKDAFASEKHNIQRWSASATCMIWKWRHLDFCSIQIWFQNNKSSWMIKASQCDTQF